MELRDPSNPLARCPSGNLIVEAHHCELLLGIAAVDLKKFEP